MRKILILALGLLLALGGAACVRDQQAPRTRVPGVDKPPDDEDRERATEDPCSHESR